MAFNGATPIFQCKNTKNNSYLCHDEEYAVCTQASPCVINMAMLETEDGVVSFMLRDIERKKNGNLGLGSVGLGMGDGYVFETYYY